MNPSSLPPSPKRRPSKQWLFIGFAIVAVVIAGGWFFVAKNNNQSKNPAQTSSQQTKQTDEQLARELQPCALLTDSERAEFNLGVGELDDRNIRGCDWDSMDEFPNILYIQTTIYPLYGLDKVPLWDDSTPQPITIDSHQAQFIVISEKSVSYGVCAIDIAIGPTKTATVRITANGKTGDKPDKYCDIVRRIAALIEPKLP